MHTINDVHQQFAEFFDNEELKPFAYLVSKKLNEGSICFDLNDTEALRQLLPPHYIELHTNAKLNVAKNPLIGTNEDTNHPFIVHKSKIYLQRYFKYETSILARIGKFLDDDLLSFEKRMEQLTKKKEIIRSFFPIQQIADQENSAYTDWQFVAVISALLNSFNIITGGPGTGKTTTVAKLLAVLFTENKDLKVALAAPTGKAAVRMGESIKASSLQVNQNIQDRFSSITPVTIYRLLKYIHDSPYFRFNKDNPLPFDVVIIDEGSMIDLALFSKLLDAIGPNTKIIILGDKDQLASVEAGSLFGDLCQTQSEMNLISSKRASFINGIIDNEPKSIAADYISDGINQPMGEHVIELKYSHRFSSEKGIGRFSKAILNNQTKVIEQFIQQKQEDQITIDTFYEKSIFQLFAEQYEDYIREQDIKTAIQKLNKIRVLCAVREGNQGVYQTNRRIEDILSTKKLIVVDSEFYHNRPVIVTKNNYSLNLFNGDVGIIRRDAQGVCRAWFEDSEHGLKSVLPGFIPDTETVFAMTIHKSQGSEYEQVLVQLPEKGGERLLTCELLYTAVTRARQKVILQGSAEMILAASASKVNRASGIQDRFFELNQSSK